MMCQFFSFIFLHLCECAQTFYICDCVQVSKICSVRISKGISAHISCLAVLQREITFCKRNLRKKEKNENDCYMAIYSSFVNVTLILKEHKILSRLVGNV